MNIEIYIFPKFIYLFRCTKYIVKPVENVVIININYFIN